MMVNAGSSESYGAEVSLTASVNRNLSLNGSYGYTYATFTDYVVSDEENYNGNYVPFVPNIHLMQEHSMCSVCVTELYSTTLL